MKTQMKAIIASAVVIVLALSAVAGVTYSWFSDTETSTIDVSSAEIDIDGTYTGVPVVKNSKGETPAETSAEFINENRNIKISNLVGERTITATYELTNKSTVNTTYRMYVTVDGINDELAGRMISITGGSGNVTAPTTGELTFTDGIAYVIGGAGNGVSMSAASSANPVKYNFEVKINSADLTSSVKFQMKIVNEAYQTDYTYPAVQIIKSGESALPTTSATSDVTYKGTVPATTGSGAKDAEAEITFSAGALNTATDNGGKAVTLNTEMLQSTDSVAKIKLTLSNNANTDFGNNYVTVKLCVPGYYTGLTVKYNGNGDQPIVLGCDYDSFKDVTVITFKTNHFSEFSVKGTKDSATRVADEAGLRAALNADIAKIQLQKDIVVSSTVSVKSTVTLDLNNNRFTMSGPYIAIDVISGGKLTITGGGFVDGGSRGNNMAVRACDGGEVIINNGTFTVGADANGIGNSVIESNGGKIIVNGGHFYTDYNYEGFYYVLNQKNNNPGTITVNGGTFVDYDPSKGDDNLGGNFVADGYSVTSEKKDNKTIYTVVPAVAEVVVPADDEYYYASLEEAFEQASRKSTGENCVTINVLKDCNGNGIVVPESSNICVNFNGHTYTMDGSMVGSPNTQTLAFQLLKDSGIVFKIRLIKEVVCDISLPQQKHRPY